MRLLRRSNSGELVLTEDLAKNDTIPPYAILSHTWGADSDEITFEDLANSTGKDKSGYKKIQFCEEQAKQDGLEYFWIDTCCINKENKAEFSHAINSMFRWYRNATRCYVYLSDVPSLSPNTQDDIDIRPWELDFPKSKWFTRGWTLQELLAPHSVEFFSWDRRRLGDKKSLIEQIHAITGIPKQALHGYSLSQFSVNKRLSWIEHRQTKLEEDRAYSLLGIFDVYIPPIYGEGTASAFKRLIDEINKLEKCLQDLRATDPRDDKKRIEETKGGLLEDSYRWIFDNAGFQQWRNGQQNRLLWIKGDPGKGKTMLLCGIANELKSLAKTESLSYFFCQATDARINNATAVLRGLLYLLVEQQPSLVSHIREKHDHAGKALFEDANAWVALVEIFTNILQDQSLSSTFLIIDALDECVVGLPELLDFIVQQSSVSHHVKWVVSSRNWPDIEERLANVGRLSLELNAESVSAAVSVFIQQKVLQLSQDKKYDDRTREAVLHHLSTNADGTFLWVALVSQNLKGVPKRNVIKKLNAFPPGLDSLYERMMQQISSSDDADICKEILSLTATVHRPIVLEELVELIEQLEDMADDPESIQEIIGHCGSFLTLRENTVYFVHQSAKDFLLAKASNDIFPSGKDEAHHLVFLRSLQIMSSALQRDMYNLDEPGCSIEQVEQPEPDPLRALRYSCSYWVDHLCDGVDPIDLQDGGSVDKFLRQKYLYWLEAMSLCKAMPTGVVSIAKLEALILRRTGSSALLELVQDARRFIMYHKVAIENTPLQTYISALVFSPRDSLIRNLFKKEIPSSIIIKPAMMEKWGACLQTLEGHGSSARSAAFSHDSTKLASASDDRTIKIWDANSGACLHTLKGHNNSVNSIAFSHDSTRLASASDDHTIKIWDTSNNACLQTLEGHKEPIMSISFSRDSTKLASASIDTTAKIWDLDSYACLQTLEGHIDWVRSVAFSHDSTWLASGSDDHKIKIWDTRNSACLQTLEGHSGFVLSIAFSCDSTRLASGSNDNTVKIWDTRNSTCIQTFEGHSTYVLSIAFSYDSTRLASGSDDSTIKIWDTNSGTSLQTLTGHNGSVRSIAFSHDSTRLVSASSDRTIKIWDADSSVYLQAPEGHSDSVIFIAFSHDLTRLASASHDKTVKIWETDSSTCLQTLNGHLDWVRSVAFSHDSTQLASASDDKTVKIWDIRNSACLLTLKGHSGFALSVAFSHDSTKLASASGDSTIKIWDVRSGECLQTLEGHSDWVRSVAFSHASTWLASGSDNQIVKIWDASSGACLHTLEGHGESVSSIAFSHDSTKLASASGFTIAKIWDTSSGACLQTIGTDRTIFSISFDATGSCLHTNIGAIVIPDLATSNTTTTSAQPQHPQYQYTALSSDGVWITYDSKKLLWLPSEYRPSSSAVSGKTICIGGAAGKVWICSLNID